MYELLAAPGWASDLNHSCVSEKSVLTVVCHMTVDYNRLVLNSNVRIVYCRQFTAMINYPNITITPCIRNNVR